MRGMSNTLLTERYHDQIAGIPSCFDRSWRVISATQACSTSARWTRRREKALFNGNEMGEDVRELFVDYPPAFSPSSGGGCARAVPCVMCYCELGRVAPRGEYNLNSPEAVVNQGLVRT